MTAFQLIRALRKKLDDKERELKSASPNTRERIRHERDVLRTALKIAMENRDEKRRAAA